MSELNLRDMRYLIKLKKEQPEVYNELLKDIVGITTDLLLASKKEFKRLNE